MKRINIKYKALITLMVGLPLLMCSHTIPFTKNGKIGASTFEIDTVLQSNIKASNHALLLRLDDNFSDTLGIRIFINNQYPQILADTMAYLLLINSTIEPIYIKRENKNIVAEEYARGKAGMYKPISLFMNRRCGSGINYTPIKIPPAAILVIKTFSSKRIVADTSKASSCFVKIMIASGKTMNSTLYHKDINSNAFYMDSDDKMLRYLKTNDFTFGHDIER
jgi:hypothetical protein